MNARGSSPALVPAARAVALVDGEEDDVPGAANSAVVLVRPAGDVGLHESIQIGSAGNAPCRRAERLGLSSTEPHATVMSDRSRRTGSVFFVDRAVLRPAATTRQARGPRTVARAEDARSMFGHHDACGADSRRSAPRGFLEKVASRLQFSTEKASSHPDSGSRVACDVTACVAPRDRQVGEVSSKRTVANSSTSSADVFSSDAGMLAIPERVAQRNRP